MRPAAAFESESRSSTRAIAHQGAGLLHQRGGASSGWLRPGDPQAFRESGPNTPRPLAGTYHGPDPQQLPVAITVARSQTQVSRRSVKVQLRCTRLSGLLTYTAHPTGSRYWPRSIATGGDQFQGHVPRPSWLAGRPAGEVRQRWDGEGEVTITAAIEATGPAAAGPSSGPRSSAERRPAGILCRGRAHTIGETGLLAGRLARRPGAHCPSPTSYQQSRVARTSGTRSRFHFPHVAFLTALRTRGRQRNRCAFAGGRRPGSSLVLAGIAVIVAPAVMRMLADDVRAGERVALVVMFGLALFAVKLMRDPFAFTLAE